MVAPIIFSVGVISMADMVLIWDKWFLDPPKSCPRQIGGICDSTLPEEHIFAEVHRIPRHIPLEELSHIDPVFAIQNS